MENQTGTMGANTASYDNPLNIHIIHTAEHENMQLFLLFGKAEIPGKRYVTLNEALSRKWVVLHETSTVSELALDNLSEHFIFINSGDIVKGGRQDRTIRTDVILAPLSKNNRLPSFCVESGRWHSRRGDDVHSFSSSDHILASKELKIAAKLVQDQREVWKEVDEYQKKAQETLNKKSGYRGIAELRMSESPTSLELTLRNKHLGDERLKFKKKLLAQLPERENANGMAVFINGKMASIDLYNNTALFADLFDKLLEAAISESLAHEIRKDCRKAKEEDVFQRLITEGVVHSNDLVNNITHFITIRTKRNDMCFKTIDFDAKKWVHLNWLERN